MSNYFLRTSSVIILYAKVGIVTFHESSSSSSGTIIIAQDPFPFYSLFPYHPIMVNEKKDEKVFTSNFFSF